MWIPVRSGCHMLYLPRRLRSYPESAPGCPPSEVPIGEYRRSQIRYGTGVESWVHPRSCSRLKRGGNVLVALPWPFPGRRGRRYPVPLLRRGQSRDAPQSPSAPPATPTKDDHLPQLRNVLPRECLEAAGRIERKGIWHRVQQMSSPQVEGSRVVSPRRECPTSRVTGEAHLPYCFPANNL